MANFQFTVRATDSDGAYADRNFAITINNTRVERYMAIDQYNAYTSPDLVNWTTRNGQGGWDCSYGNSMWLIVTNSLGPNAGLMGGGNLGGGQYAGNNTMVIRKSTDGVNYATLTQASGQVKFVNADNTNFTIPSGALAYGRLSFSNGFFWLPVSWSQDFTAPGNITTFVARSADGVTWTVLPMPGRGQFYYVNGIGSYLRNFAKVQDSGSDIFIPNYGANGGFTVNIYGWRSADLGVTWTPIVDSTGKANGVVNYFSPMVTRINGLYIASHTMSASIPFMISNDGINWSPCNPVSAWNTSFPIHSVVYANGTLVAVGNTTSTGGGSPYILQSTDGVTWNQVISANGAYSGATGPYNQYAGLTYKNGFLVVSQNSYNSTANKVFSYQFAGSGDPFTAPSSPTNTTNNPQIPFSYVNGFAAMGS